MSADRWHVQLFGPVGLTPPDGSAIQVPATAGRALAALCVTARPLARIELATMLWPEANTTNASANLRTLLWRHHEFLEPCIVDTGHHLSIQPDLATDLGALRSAWRRLADAVGGTFESSASEASATRLLLRRAAVNELCAGWNAEWLAIHRLRVRHQALAGLELLAAQLAQAGRTELAIEAAATALSVDGARVSACRLVLDLASDPSPSTPTTPGQRKQGSSNSPSSKLMPDRVAHLGGGLD